MSFSELPPVFVVGAVQEALMTPAWLEAATRRIPVNVSPIGRNQRAHHGRYPSAFCLGMFTLRSGEPILTLRDPGVPSILRLSTTEAAGVSKGCLGTRSGGIADSRGPDGRGGGWILCADLQAVKS